MSNQSKRRLSTSIVPPDEFNAFQRRPTLSPEQQYSPRTINTAQYDILEAAGLDYKMTIQEDPSNATESTEKISIQVPQSTSHDFLDVEALLNHRKSVFDIKMDMSDLQNIKRVPSSRKHSIDAFTKRHSIDTESRRNSSADTISSISTLDLNCKNNSIDLLNQSIFRKPKKRIVLSPALKQEMREGTVF